MPVVEKDSQEFLTLEPAQSLGLEVDVNSQVKLTV